MGRLNCNEPGHKWRECTKLQKEELKHETLNAVFKCQRGCEKEGRLHPPIGNYRPSPSSCESLGQLPNPPDTYWNDDPRGHWLGPENLGYAFLNGYHTWVLVDNGVRMNTVTPAYALTHDLQVGPILELQEVKDKIPIQGVVGYCTGPLG